MASEKIIKMINFGIINNYLNIKKKKNPGQRASHCFRPLKYQTAKNTGKAAQTINSPFFNFHILSQPLKPKFGLEKFKSKFKNVIMTNL